MQTAVGVFGNEDNQPNMISKPSILALEVARDRNIESEEDNLWRPDVREFEEEILARGLQFMKWLGKRPEKEVAVVSHGIVLQHMLYVFANDCDVSVRHELCKRFC
uniref:Phosphoglycerate mutase-like protein n=1 Tax=Brassica oleracea var. oleracea TaxID=109376 RepID=A0A0D3C8X0_BRAOL